MNHSPYLNQALSDLPAIVERAHDALRGKAFDAIVVTGVSGLLVGSALAYAMKKRLAVVRKADDRNNHAIVGVESGMELHDRWIFVDDIIASGRTIARVRRIMADTMVGNYMYNWNEWTEGD